MPDEEIIQNLEKKINALADDLEELKYIVSKKTGSGSSDVKGTVTKSLVTTSKFQSHSATDEGIKIFVEPPVEIKGDTGVYLPTANAEPAAPYNGAVWTNPTYAYTISGTYATAVQGGKKYTIWKGFTGLQAAIPVTATITGITVKCYAKVDTVAEIPEPTLEIYLTKDGANIVGTGRNSEILTKSDALVVAGSSKDLWGTTWARTDIISSFGVMISGTGTSSPSTTYSIDYIQVIVQYTIDLTDAFENSIADAFMELWNGAGQSTLIYLQRNTSDLYFDKANLNVLGSLTVTPPEAITGNTGAELTTANAEPASPLNGVPWTNPTYAYTADANYANSSQGTIHYHIWKGFDLLDSIPSGATITGIKVECYAKVDTTANLDANGRKLNLQLSKDGSTVVGSTALTETLTTSVALVSAGGDESLWGTTWTKGDFGLDFGVMINGNGASTPATDFWIDYIQITVYYTTTTDSSISSNILPGSDDTYDLGSSSKRYSTIYVRKVILDEDDYKAGDSVVSFDPKTKTVTSSGYEKKREFTLDKAGTLRIKFYVAGDDGSDTLGYGKIYRNGVAVGTERSSESGSTFTEDISGWSRGDLVQLYAKTANESFPGLVKNFGIYADLAGEYPKVPVIMME